MGTVAQTAFRAKKESFPADVNHQESDKANRVQPKGGDIGIVEKYELVGELHKTPYIEDIRRYRYERERYEAEENGVWNNHTCRPSSHLIAVEDCVKNRRADKTVDRGDVEREEPAGHNNRYQDEDAQRHILPCFVDLHATYFLQFSHFLLKRLGKYRPFGMIRDESSNM